MDGNFWSKYNMSHFANMTAMFHGLICRLEGLRSWHITLTCHTSKPSFVYWKHIGLIIHHENMDPYGRVCCSGWGEGIEGWVRGHPHGWWVVGAVSANWMSHFAWLICIDSYIICGNECNILLRVHKTLFGIYSLYVIILRKSILEFIHKETRSIMVNSAVDGCFFTGLWVMGYFCNII